MQLLITRHLTFSAGVYFCYNCHHLQGIEGLLSFALTCLPKLVNKAIFMNVRALACIFRIAMKGHVCTHALSTVFNCGPCKYSHSGIIAMKQFFPFVEHNKVMFIGTSNQYGAFYKALLNSIQ